MKKTHAEISGMQDSRYSAGIFVDIFGSGALRMCSMKCIKNSEFNSLFETSANRQSNNGKNSLLFFAKKRENQISKKYRKNDQQKSVLVLNLV